MILPSTARECSTRTAAGQHCYVRVDARMTISARIAIGETSDRRRPLIELVLTRRSARRKRAPTATLSVRASAWTERRHNRLCVPSTERRTRQTESAIPMNHRQANTARSRRPQTGTRQARIAIHAARRAPARSQSATICSDSDVAKTCAVKSTSARNVARTPAMIARCDVDRRRVGTLTGLEARTRYRPPSHRSLRCAPGTRDARCPGSMGRTTGGHWAVAGLRSTMAV